MERVEVAASTRLRAEISRLDGFAPVPIRLAAMIASLQHHGLEVSMGEGITPSARLAAQLINTANQENALPVVGE